MYVSGSLKNKTIDFYREDMVSFNGEHMKTKDAVLGYDGHLTLSNDDKYKKLKERQELLIQREIDYLMSLDISESLGLHFHLILNEIQTTSRFYTFALLEALRQIIVNSSYLSQLENQLIKFHNFIKNLNTCNYIRSQVDLDIAIKLFLSCPFYSAYYIKQEKEKIFHIKDEEFLSNETQDIIKLGEFIAPKRVPIIAQDLQSENELSRYVAPIYFALKSDAQAKYFLDLCRKLELNFYDIKKNAVRCRVPNNLIQMIRR